MKKLSGFLIILLITLLGELLAAVIALPVPACIYGMVLMFLGLCTGLIPLEAVRGTGKFLIEVMPVMFVPAAVGLLDTWPALQGMLIPCLIALVPVTLLVMAVSGWVTQLVLRLQERGKRHAADPD